MSDKNISYSALYFILVISSYVPKALELNRISSMSLPERSSHTQAPSHKHPVTKISTDTPCITPCPPCSAAPRHFPATLYPAFNIASRDSLLHILYSPPFHPFNVVQVGTREKHALPYSHFFFLLVRESF